ncbi:MAG TPA: hypothetical protein GXZ82_13835 [Firmicutes bacterium]|jgi:hypothetical protein|nr:hypothetical protein [Bacillota bacterium]
MKRRASRPLNAIKWIARIWGAITSITYIYIWASYTAGQPQSSFNLITVCVTIASLTLAWRWELMGGLLAIAMVLTRISVDYYHSIYNYSLIAYWNHNQLDILGWLALFIAPALLFVAFWVLSHLRPKKRKRPA